jgi:hypothetical protein
MAMRLTTERLVLRPWVNADIEHYRTLVAERGAGTPSVMDVRARIATQRVATARTGGTGGEDVLGAVKPITCETSVSE